MPRRCLLAVMIVCAAAAAAAAAPASAATVDNGSFETGSFSGWTVDRAGNGSWLINSGGAPNAMAPTHGLHDAYTTQSGAGSLVLYQDVALEAGREHVLSFDLGYRNTASFRTPESLEHVGVQNQQLRVDVIQPTAPVRSVAASDVLAVVFRTAPGFPPIQPMAGVTADLTAFAGQTIRLRVAVVDNLGNFFATLDEIEIASATIDADGDGIRDESDDCPSVADADQVDGDGDGQGDACDADDDNDGVDDAEDNCAVDVNPEQTDQDGDGRGDACDPDVDGDGVSNVVDNCPGIANDGQVNTDGDSDGDACDGDDDSDGVPDDAPDNCRVVVNPDQADVDADGRGTACDDVELPTSGDQCKACGWHLFYDGAMRFRSQGDCASFVATGGRNPPAAGPLEP